MKEPTVAYFSAEYAIADDMPIYAGGLGVLAADMVLEAANQSPGVIGAEGACHICRRISKISQTRTFDGSGLSFTSERGRLHASLRRYVNFHGSGGGTGAWSMLPASRMVDANRFLDDAEVEAERVRKASGVEDKQGRLFQFPKPA